MADWKASLSIFGGNNIDSGRHQSLYVPFHEIAQINVAAAAVAKALIKVVPRGKSFSSAF